MSLLVQMPDMGLNSLVPPNELDPRGAAKFTQNILYQYGILRTPTGFAKVDLTSGLNSGDSVLATFRFTEIDGYDHHIAVTTEKIFRHDLVNSNWDTDITQSGITMNSDLWHPISWVPILHDDTDIYLDDDTGKGVAYHHLVVCDGGLSNIQRWAGRWETDFGDLVGAGGYHDGTTHKALQVGTYKSRTILISPQEYDSSTKAWVKNNARVRWPMAGKLQTWTGTGSSFADLLETNDQNVWSSLLGNQYIIYQKHSIWGLNYIGGDDVFDPLPLIKDLGLLSHHLLISRNNIHYFIGDDFNVYKYYGGTVKQAIGDEIHKNLQDDLDPDYAARCWLVMSPRGEFLWIYIVPSGSQYITKAYGRNMKTGAWTIRDLTHKWSTGGITAVNLVGGQSYTIGDTYAEALETLSAYDADISKSTAGDITQRYGDVLLEGTINRVDWTNLDATLDFTDIEFSAGGLFFCFSASADPTKLIGDNTAWDNTAWSPLIMQIKEGSDSDNMPYGAHYYSLTDISSVDAGGGDYTVKVNLAPRDTTGNAVSDLSTDIPGINAVSTDCSGSLYDPSGETYRQKLEEHRTDDALIYGDSDGYIYQDDVDLTTDDGEDALSLHFTKIFDGELPDIFKRFPGIAIVAKGSSVNVQYRVSSFDTSESSWISIS